MDVSPETLMYEILQAQEELDQVVCRLNKDGSAVFINLSIKKPKFEPAELGFILSVSWLFVLYYEAGKVGVDFLCKRLQTYGIANDGFCDRHYSLVQKFRTYLQHNLDLTTVRNRKIQETCEEWLKQQCGSPLPGDNGQWRMCLVALLSEAKVFLGSLRDCVRQIERDESVEAILDAWDFQKKRFHPTHEFDTLIAIVAADMGRDKLDPVRFRLRYYERWTKDLELLEGLYDFAVEGRKLIEHALMQDTTPVLPITGRDIMEQFGVQPGPIVGELLEKARAIFEAEGGSRDEVLAKLKDVTQEAPVESVTNQ